MISTEYVPSSSNTIFLITNLDLFPLFSIEYLDPFSSLFPLNVHFISSLSEIAFTSSISKQTDSSSSTASLSCNDVLSLFGASD